MKTLYTALLFLFTSLLVNAQREISYKVGTPYPVVDAFPKEYFEYEGSIIAIKKAKRDLVIQRLNASTLKLEGKEGYRDMPENYIKEGIIKFDGRLFFFYSLWDKPNRAEQLYYREIDFKKGTFVSEGKRLIRVDGKLSGVGMPDAEYPVRMIGFRGTKKFDISTSADDSKLLIRYNTTCDVYQGNLEKIWSEKIEIPYDYFNHIDFSVDAFGNVFILSKVYLDDTYKDFKKDKSCNYRMGLLKVNGTTRQITQTNIDIKDKFTHTAYIYESSKGAIICAGFYNENGRDGSDAKGVFSATLKKDGSFNEFKTHEIPLEVLNQYVNKKTQARNEKQDDKGKGEFENLVLRKMVTSDDGSVLLIGEQNYIITKTTTSADGKSSTYYKHYFKDLLITKINQDGTLAWMKKLAKRQRGGYGRGGMSFKHFTKENNHYFLFLDNVKNLRAPKDQLPEMHIDGAGGYLTAYKVNDSSGEVNKISILNLKEVTRVDTNELRQFAVNRVLNISDNQFIIEFYKKKKEDVLLRFTINE